MDDSLNIPSEVLAFLVRSLPPKELWQWLSEDERLPLRQRVARGFRATAEVLRQPAARTRLVSHLESDTGDTNALIKIWGMANPAALKAVRAASELTTSVLLGIQMQHGPESLLLALLHEEKEEAIETLVSSAEELDSVTNELPPPEESTGTPDSKSEIAKLQKQLEREKQKTERWHEKWRELHTRSTQTEKTLRAGLDEAEKKSRESQKLLKAETNRASHLEEKLTEAAAARERAERRAKALQPELEGAQQEVKTIRRQLQRLQQINEELRGQIKAKEAQIEEAKKQTITAQPDKKSQAPSTAIEPPVPKNFSPQDSITKIVDAINRNNEAFVATLRQQLEVLRAHDPKTFQSFLKRLRTAGKYYEGVLTRPVTRVMVDASNVARYDTQGKGRLSNLVNMREELQRHNCFPIIFIADASLPYNIDDAKALRAMATRGELILTTSGQQADEILAREARTTGAYVVTNDKNFHYDFAPDFTPQRIGFNIADNVVMLDEF